MIGLLPNIRGRRGGAREIKNCFSCFFCFLHRFHPFLCSGFIFDRSRCNFFFYLAIWKKRPKFLIENSLKHLSWNSISTLPPPPSPSDLPFANWSRQVHSSGFDWLCHLTAFGRLKRMMHTGSAMTAPQCRANDNTLIYHACQMHSYRMCPRSHVGVKDCLKTEFRRKFFVVIFERDWFT